MDQCARSEMQVFNVQMSHTDGEQTKTLD